MADEPEPVADLVRTGSRSSRRRRRRLLAPDRRRGGRAETRSVTASMAIAIGAVRSWTRKPLIPKASELGRRAAGGQGAVGLDQPLALDDRRQVGVVGGVEERRQDRRQRRRRRAAATNVRTPSANATGIEPSSTARPRSAQMRTGRRRSRSTQAPATSPNDQRRRRGRAPRRMRDLDRPGAEHQDRDERQRDPGDERAEDRDRRRRPDPDEGAVAPERGGERVAHEGGA